MKNPCQRRSDPGVHIRLLKLCHRNRETNHARFVAHVSMQIRPRRRLLGTGNNMPPPNPCCWPPTRDEEAGSEDSAQERARLNEAAGRLVQLYETTGKRVDAASGVRNWRHGARQRVRRASYECGCALGRRRRLATSTRSKPMLCRSANFGFSTRASIEEIRASQRRRRIPGDSSSAFRQRRLDELAFLIEERSHERTVAMGGLGCSPASHVRRPITLLHHRDDCPARSRFAAHVCCRASGRLCTSRASVLDVYPLACLERRSSREVTDQERNVIDALANDGFGSGHAAEKILPNVFSLDRS